MPHSENGRPKIWVQHDEHHGAYEGGGAAFANPTDRIGSEEEFVGSDEARPSSSAAPGAGGGVGDGGRRDSRLPRERGERERERGEGIVAPPCAWRRTAQCDREAWRQCFAGARRASAAADYSRRPSI